MHSDVSRYLLELYRAARRMPHAVFRPWAFRELSNVIQFDSAFWYRWAVDQAQPVYASYLFEQPQFLLDEYVKRELWREDVVAMGVLTTPPGTAIAASRDDYTSEAMKDFLVRYRQEQVLTIAYYREIARIATGFSLYRTPGRNVFAPEELRVIESIAPHFIEAWRENWLAELIRQASSRPIQPEFSLAELAHDGRISEAQNNFADFMQSQWPAWKGPRVPEVVDEHFEREEAPWIGSEITIYQKAHPQGSKLLLVRRSHALDCLSPRKRSVAVLVGQGVAQSDVANRLNLSPSTVNNYLSEVYERLDIHDKVMLSTLVSALEP